MIVDCAGNDGSRVKTMRVDWSKPESKRIQVVVRSRPLNIREIKVARLLVLV